MCQPLEGVEQHRVAARALVDREVAFEHTAVSAEILDASCLAHPEVHDAALVDEVVGFANINAKAEGIETKPAFREAFQRRRCLVPVDGFYEWKKTATGKQPMRSRSPTGT
jgi:hypothetical protein